MTSRQAFVKNRANMVSRLSKEGTYLFEVLTLEIPHDDDIALQLGKLFHCN